MTRVNDALSFTPSRFDYPAAISEYTDIIGIASGGTAGVISLDFELVCITD